MLRITSIYRVLLLTILAVFNTHCSNDQIIEMENLERDLLLTWIALEREDASRGAIYNQ